MAAALAQTLVEFSVAETSEGRGYWLDRPWVSEDRRPALLKSAILVVPRMEGEDTPVFPSGAGDFLARLQTALGEAAPVGVAMSSDGYVELALHSKAWRLPTMILSAVVLPVVITILADRLNEVIPGFKSEDTAEIIFIVETPDRGDLKVSYKGPADEMGDFLQSSVAKFVDTPARPAAPAAPSEPAASTK